ncbi:MAG: hypothetical protein PVJ80_14575 [Gemmatimonadota bacterium]|jgi:hypothetical protein
MKTHARISVLVLGLLALGAVLAPTGASGQQGGKPLFLALPQHFPDVSARVVIVREAGRDLVILRESDAAPETLYAALSVLGRMQREHPLGRERAQLVPITGFVYRGPLDPDLRADLAKVLADLRERPLANVGNLGLGHWARYAGD